MSKQTQRKSLAYVKKEYVRTRTMPANWHLTSYKYKFNITHMAKREKTSSKSMFRL
jgi:hypothetical protein